MPKKKIGKKRNPTCPRCKKRNTAAHSWAAHCFSCGHSWRTKRLV